MPRQFNLDELAAGLPHILAAPSDGGRVLGLVVRPEKRQRREVESVEASAAGGVAGDHWAMGCWKSTVDGRPHPDVQIAIMNARCIDLVAGERSNWAPAGDNLFVDMDLSAENLPTGTRLRIGTVTVEVTDTPHNGCSLFIQRYGRDACTFVNSVIGKRHRLRGVYVRVVEDGRINIGDVATKVA